MSTAIYRERIYESINNCNLDCRKIAEMVGKERKAIYSYRDGISSPDAFTLMKLCIVLGVSADWLLGLEVKEK